MGFISTPVSDVEYVYLYVATDPEKAAERKLAVEKLLSSKNYKRSGFVHFQNLIGMSWDKMGEMSVAILIHFPRTPGSMNRVMVKYWWEEELDTQGGS